MSVSACQHVHLCMDMQPCRHGHAEMQTWTCRDPGMQTCRDGHAPRQDKGIDMQTRKHGHAHVDSHGDMNMQTWTCKLADTLMQTCRTCRRGYAGMTCDLEVGMAGTSKAVQKMAATGTFGHANTEPHAFRHGHANMDVLQRCSHGEMDMERWI